MSVLKVTEVRDLAGIGGFSFSSGTVTALGTLKVDELTLTVVFLVALTTLCHL